MVKNSFYLEVNQEAILNNVKILKDWKKKNIIPVIKANAYGHGIVEMASTCLYAGLTQVAVARYEEAKEVLEDRKFQSLLREEQEFQILVFESIQSLEEISFNRRIDFAVNSMEELVWMVENGVSTKRLHIKIDFGFGRNGIDFAERETLKEYVLRNNLYCKGIFSHLFSVSYEDGLEIISKFSSLITELGRERFERIHLQNSAASYNYDCPFVTDLRIGMLVYGLQEPGYYHEKLQQAFCLKGKIDRICSLESIKYVAYETKSDLSLGEKPRIAKIKIGYADGFGKQNENSVCLIGRKEYNIVEVTMDNTFIVVDGRVQEGDEVILFYNPSLLKTTTGRHIYENLTVLSKRLPRKWVKEKC